MSVRALVLPCLVVVVAACTSNAAVRTEEEGRGMESLRARICLNGMWELHEGGTLDRVPAEGWRPVRVPEEFGDWSREAGWYRLRFRVPEEFVGKRVTLEVGRVRFYGKAFVNGAACGESWQPRLPLVADITQAVKVGGENELLVFVHCLAEGYSNPGEPLKNPSARGALIPYYDSADLAGIFGDVFLTCHPEVSVSEVQIMPSVRNGELRVRARVTNEGSKAVEATLSCSVEREGKTALSLPEVVVKVAPGETEEVEVAAKWSHPALWGPPPFGEPVLYHLQTDLVSEGGLLDRRYDRFGFRELWVEGNNFIFNGKPVFLMGTHISGFEMREAMSLLVPKLQQAGFLFVHPHADNRLDSFYQVCDEMGMLVWDCTFCGGPIGNGFGRWGGNRQDALRDALPYLTDAYRGWIRRNRNHPSIVIWSAGCNNASVNADLKALILEEDPSRPVVRYHTPESDREVLMFGFPGWQGEEPDYSRGIADIEAQLKRRGDRKYPLWIGEYWSQSGRPRAMEITYDMGVAGGCTFDVGGYRGNLPPFPRDFTITWPSQSGVGQRRQNLFLRGHKKTFPEYRHPNWCDPSKPVFRGEWQEEPGYRAVAEKANSKPGPARVRVPEVIVTVTAGGKPVASEYVFVLPEAGQSTSAVGVMTDPDGRAWFVLEESGNYRAVCGGEEAVFEASGQPLRLEPGYGYIQRIGLGD